MPEGSDDVQPVRYGVIGTGMMGVEHIENIRALEGCTVTAIADPHESSRERARTVVGRDTPLAVFDSIEPLLESGECDALVIATPNHTHHDMLIPAIESGLHLLVEKPLCTTLADCREVVDLVATRPDDQVIWMGLEYRYMPPVRRLLQELAQGTVGDVKMVAIREHRFPFLDKVEHWNRFNRNTGGTLVEKTCHFFDLMLRITQSRPARVFASGNQDVNHLDERYDGEVPDILDNAFVVVDFESGSRGLLDLCMFAEASKNEREISVVGPQGKIEALDTESVVRIGRRTPDIFSGVHAVIEETITDTNIKHVGLHHGASFLEHVDFVDAIRNGAPPAVTVLDGLWAAAIGVAAHRSIERGAPVLMSELRELDGLDLPR